MAKAPAKFGGQGLHLPVPTTPIVSDEVYEDDLEALINAEELAVQNAAAYSQDSAYEAFNGPDSDLAPELPKSWLAPWPRERRIRDSTVFRQFRHSGVKKKEGNL